MIRSRSPGRDAVVSGASSMASTENRLWRIFGCLAGLCRGLRVASRGGGSGCEPLNGWRRERLTGASIPSGRPAGYGGPGHGRAHRSAANGDRAEVGIPSVEALGRAQATRRTAGHGQRRR